MLLQQEKCTLLSLRESFIHDAADDAVIEYLQIKGSTVIDHGRCPVNRIRELGSKSLRVAFFSTQIYQEQIKLKIANKKLIPLKVKRHIESESIFSDPFVHRYRASLGQDWATIDVLATPQWDIEQIKNTLPFDQLPCRLLSSSETAIAALLAQVSQEPLIVIWASEKTLTGLLVQKGSILARRLDYIQRDFMGDESADTRSLQQKISQAEMLCDKLNQTAQSLLHQEIDTRLCFGDLPDWLARAEADELNIEIMSPLSHRQEHNQRIYRQLGRLFSSRKQLNLNIGSDLLKRPELYGLPFVKNHFNLLEKGYQQNVSAYIAASPIAVSVSALALGFMSLGAQQFHASSLIKQDIEARQQRLEKNVERVQNRLPPENEIRAMNSIIELSNKLDSELRVDRFLSWITHAVPEGVLIKSLEIKPALIQKGRNGKARKVEGEYWIEMESVAKGTYAHGKQLAAILIERLGQKTRLSDTSFEYKPTNINQGTALIRSTLSARAEIFR